MDNRQATHKELLLQFLEEVKELMDEVKRVNEDLKVRKDYDERTQSHRTRGLIRKWLGLEELKY